MVRRRQPNRRLAGAGFGVFRALALNGFGLCVWRWLFDLELVRAFPFYQGVLSHWQTWFICGAVLQLLANGLAKYARDSRELTPRGVMRAQSAAHRRRRFVAGRPAARRRVVGMKSRTVGTTTFAANHTTEPRP